MKIEFFHNVTCGYCYIMSSRLEEVLKEFPDAEVVHKAFPLNYYPSETDLESYEDKKENAVKKWRGANMVDEQKRFNIEGFENADFASPNSKKAMTAIRAASLAGLDYGEVFDYFQSALFEKALNIEDETVIKKLIHQLDLDYDLWESYYENPETMAIDEADFKLVEDYGIDLIPAYVVNEETVIQGAKRTDLLSDLFKETLDK